MSREKYGFIPDSNTDSVPAVPSLHVQRDPSPEGSYAACSPCPDLSARFKHHAAGNTAIKLGFGKGQ